VFAGVFSVFAVDKPVESVDNSPEKRPKKRHIFHIM
jgi:hypothetical protein